LASLDGLERIHSVAKTYGLRPSDLVESQDWTALRKFRFDEAVLLAGMYAERRATEEARSLAEETKEAPRDENGYIVGQHEASDAGLPAHARQVAAGAVPAARGPRSLPQGARTPEIDLMTGTLVGGVVPYIGDD